MWELVVWHVFLSPSKRSVRPMPVICRFISGFVYLMYNAFIISNRLKSFSCLIILVLLTICSLFNVLLWKSWLCLSGAPDWRCIVILRERVVRVYPIYAWGSQSTTLHSYLYRIFVLCSLVVFGLFFHYCSVGPLKKELYTALLLSKYFLSLLFFQEGSGRKRRSL